MHPTIARAYELLNQEVTERDPLAVDAAEHWNAMREQSVPPSHHRSDTKGQRVSNPEMIAALAKHEVAKSIREHGTVTRTEMRAYVQQSMEQFAEMMGAETGTLERRLRDEIATLKAEIETLRSEPLDLPKLKLIGEGR